MQNGSHVLVDSTNDYKFNSDNVLKNVLYFLIFKYNLISILKLTSKLSCFITFYPKVVVLQDLSSGTILGTSGKESGILSLNFHMTLVCDLFLEMLLCFLLIMLTCPCCGKRDLGMLLHILYM